MLITLQVLVLRNRGFLICGESIEEAVFMLHKAVAACETQVWSLSSIFCCIFGTLKYLEMIYLMIFNCSREHTFLHDIIIVSGEINASWY